MTTTANCTQNPLRAPPQRAVASAPERRSLPVLTLRSVTLTPPAIDPCRRCWHHQRVHHRPPTVSWGCAADNAARRWSVIVPVKELHAAKSRLNRTDRADLALAMARDTVRAAAAATAVAEVIVVTDDPRALKALQGPGVRILPDSPRAGLNAALRHAADSVLLDSEGEPDTSVAALSADLPALRPAELDLALHTAAAYDRAFLADAAGTGTVLLTATAGHELRPEYGPDSRR